MTQEQFNQNYGRIAMPKPFAHNGLITPIVDIGDATHPVNFNDGFPSQYSSPHSQGGKYVTRGEFNAIGNLASRNDFYWMCGGLNTFNSSLASKIGGYPKSAVLDQLLGNKLYKVVSLVDNNTHDFNTEGVTGAYWAYCNQDLASGDDDYLVTNYSQSVESVPGMESVGVGILSNFIYSIASFTAPKTGSIYSTTSAFNFSKGQSATVASTGGSSFYVIVGCGLILSPAYSTTTPPYPTPFGNAGWKGIPGGGSDIIGRTKSLSDHSSTDVYHMGIAPNVVAGSKYNVALICGAWSTEVHTSGEISDIIASKLSITGSIYIR